MPDRVTQAKLFQEISNSIREANRQGQHISIIYLNETDLNLITPGKIVSLFGVTLTVSRVVPPAHFCPKTSMEEVRHISREACRPLL